MVSVTQGSVSALWSFFTGSASLEMESDGSMPAGGLPNSTMPRICLMLSRVFAAAMLCSATPARRSLVLGETWPLKSKVCSFFSFANHLTRPGLETEILRGQGSRDIEDLRHLRVANQTGKKSPSPCHSSGGQSRR